MYINFYLANGAVIAPLFADPSDEVALKVLSGAFPRRRVVGVPAWTLAHSDGGIHCVTQQQLAARAASGRS